MDLENKREKDSGVHFPSYGMDDVGMSWYNIHESNEQCQKGQYLPLGASSQKEDVVLFDRANARELKSLRLLSSALQWTNNISCTKQ